MLTYYVYSLETGRVVAVITGRSNAACERAAEAWSSNDYAGTYSPAFGATGGLPDLDGSETRLDADDA